MAVHTRPAAAGDRRRRRRRRPHRGRALGRRALRRASRASRSSSRVGATVGVTTIEYEPGGGGRPAGPARPPDPARTATYAPQRAQPRHERPQPPAGGRDRAQRDDPDRRRRSSAWAPGSRSSWSTSTTARASGSSRSRSCPEMRYIPRPLGAAPARRDLMEASRMARYTRRSAPVAACVRSRLLRRSPLPDRARRSLKTQQHAHFGSNLDPVCVQVRSADPSRARRT